MPRTRVWFSKSWGRDLGQLLAKRCLQRVAVYLGHSKRMSATVSSSLLQGQAIFSKVCWGKNLWVYSPTKVWPVMMQPLGAP
jgi:hypothetical protein